MIRFTFLLFILIPFFTNAQETEEVTGYTCVMMGPNYREAYYVLKSNKITKHGQYTKTYPGLQEETCYYKNDIKDSLWTLTDLSDDHIIAIGNYTNGIKTGTWTCYKAKDTKERQFDYSSKQLVSYLKDTSSKALVISGNDPIVTQADRPPFWLLGKETIINIIGHSIHYPDDARENNQQGKVMVAFTVYSDGHTSPPWIKKGVAKSLDEEALRVANLIPTDFAPAIVNGKPVISIYIQPISFKME